MDKHERRIEICDAIRRYVGARKVIPKEWLNEIGDLFNEDE